MGGGRRIAGVAGLDDEILAKLRGVGGEELVHELIRLYLTHTPERMRRARRALAQGDLDRAAKAVHSLRSASATLGAGELAGVLQGIESAADKADSEAVVRRWPEVEGRVAALLEVLEERIAPA